MGGNCGGLIGKADTWMMRLLCVLLALGLMAGCERGDGRVATGPTTGVAVRPAGEIQSPPEHAGRGTVAQRVAYYGPAARSRMVPARRGSGVAYGASVDGDAVCGVGRGGKAVAGEGRAVSVDLRSTAKLGAPASIFDRRLNWVRERRSLIDG
jgi:hypothetical protein